MNNDNRFLANGFSNNGNPTRQFDLAAAAYNNVDNSVAQRVVFNPQGGYLSTLYTGPVAGRFGNRFTGAGGPAYNFTGNFANGYNGFNGNFRSRPSFGYGAFRNRARENIADNALTNGYNLARSGMNYDYRRFRRQNSLPAYINGPTGLMYQNGYPYYGNPVLYNQSLINTDPALYRQALYNNNLAAISDYPPVAPQCLAATSCASYPNPNDCRSCVAGLGGSSTCANQICGPHVL